MRQHVLQQQRGNNWNDVPLPRVYDETAIRTQVLQQPQLRVLHYVVMSRLLGEVANIGQDLMSEQPIRARARTRTRTRTRARARTSYRGVSFSRLHDSTLTRRQQYTRIMYYVEMSRLLGEVANIGQQYTR